jgi:2'-5' RNA ligase
MEFRHTLIEAASSDWCGCLMLSLPKDVSEYIQRWGKTHIRDESLANNGRETYSHVSILYGFSQSTKFESVSEFLKRNFSLDVDSVVDICLGEIKRFDCPEYDVIYVDVQRSFLLHQMHHALKDFFLVKTSYPTYNPHVTVAYVQKGAHSELDGEKVFCDLNLECKEMTYSYGPREDRTVKKLTYESFSQQARYSCRVN